MSVLLYAASAWATYSTPKVTEAQDSKGNALVSGGYYRILLPNRDGNVALKTAANNYVQAYNGLGILGYMWKVEEDADGKALISTPAGGYWKFTEYAEGNSKLQSIGTADDCTHFQLAWYSSGNKTLNMFDNSVEGSGYSYDGVYCGYVLSNHGGVGKNMGIFNNIGDGGSIFKFERFYQTRFVVETTDANGVAVESYPTTVTINGNVTTAEYYTNPENQITSFSTAYAAAYYIDGVEKTAEEVKNAINTNTGNLTVTVKPRPFIASTNETPAYYALMISSNANSWLEGSGTEVNCDKDRALPGITGRTNWMWQLVQDGTNGYRIYNVGTKKYIGGRTATGGYLTLVDAASANSFIAVYNNATTIKFKDKTNSLWIDRSGGKTYAHTSGQQFTFKRMNKVTFSQDIRVNYNNEAVSTIYVACDGSDRDSFTLPADFTYTISGVDYNATDAAATIAAAGTNDINVTVKIVENLKMYRLMQKWSGTAYYLHSNTADSNHGNRLWKSTTAPDVTNANYVWEAKSSGESGENWKFHNIGGDRWIATASDDSRDGTNVNALSANTANNAEAFKLISASSCSYPPSDFSTVNYVALKATSRVTYLNSYSTNNSCVGWHNAVHAGYYFKFIPVKKVTFNEAVAVNGGDAVSTIYVAADGSDSFTLPSSKLYSINGAAAVTNTEAVAAIAAAGTSDITVTVSDNSYRNVTYTLNWSDGTQLSQVADVTAYLNASSSEFLPSAMANDFVTLSYSPETITSETSEVVVTATWNGPFQISSDFASAKWYTVGIHTSYESENHIWKYDSGNSDIIATEAVATNAYASLSDKNYFCFVGNPYNGFSIYNKAAGSGMTLYKSTTNGEHAKMASTGSLFIPGASREGGKTIANGYACFLVSDGTFYLNCNAGDNFKVSGWNDNDAGSTCWFKTPSSYPLNFLNAYVLTAPAGAVGTVNVAADVMAAANDLKTYFADNPFYFATANAVELNMVLQTLNKLKAASEITLTDGYYRVISAVPGFNAAAAWYYNPAVSTTNIVWAKAATTAEEHQVNSIFKFTANEDKWNIYSPNAQQSITTGNGTWNVQNAALGEAAPLTVTSIGAAQYTLQQSNNAQTLHAEGHSNGDGSNGNLITWNSNGQGEASAWYIVKVDELPLTLHDGGDGNYYATLCLPFEVTLSGCDAYTMTLNGKYLVPSKEAITPVPAGTPVLLRGTTAKATAQIAADAATGAPLTTTDLRGCYVPTLVSDVSVDGKNVYTLGYMEGEDGGVGFYRYTGSSIRANCAYLLLDASSQVRGFRFDFGGTDAITHVVTPTKPDAPLYDLQGRRVGNATHGIYIQNGKKILK